jgi:hypothetical protein
MLDKKFSSVLFTSAGVLLVGVGAYFMHRSNSIEALSPSDMFKKIRMATKFEDEKKLVERFGPTVRVCNANTTKEFAIDDPNCEQKLFIDVWEYCLEEDILKTRFSIIGSILILLGIGVVANVGIHLWQKKEEESAPKAWTRHVVFWILCTALFVGLAGYFVYARTIAQYKNSDVLRRLSTDEKLDVGKMETIFGTDVSLDILQGCGGVGFQNTRLTYNGNNDSRTPALPDACKLGGTSEPVDPPLAKCETSRATGTSLAHVVTATCAETATASTADPPTTTNVGAGRRTKNAYLWDGTRCSLSDSDRARMCRLVDTRTFREIADDFKGRERNVMWAFLGLVAAAVSANMTMLKWKRMK